MHLELERNGETITYDVVTSDQVDGLSHLFDSHPLLADLNIDVDHLLTDLEAVEQKVLFISDTDAVQDFTRAQYAGFVCAGWRLRDDQQPRGTCQLFRTADGVVVLKVVRDNTLGSRR